MVPASFSVNAAGLWATRPRLREAASRGATSPLMNDATKERGQVYRHGDRRSTLTRNKSVERPR
jgi:hypothetical protein